MARGEGWPEECLGPGWPCQRWPNPTPSRSYHPPTHPTPRHPKKHTHPQIKSKELTYNGKGFHQFRVERSSAYISQIDEHFGELTVRETFDFSARCQASGYRTTIIERLAEAEKAQGIVPDPELDAFMKAAIYAKGKDASLQVDSTLGLLGLEGCADTVVGNAMLRGISGGQKKRVTTVRCVVLCVACVLLWGVRSWMSSDAVALRGAMLGCVPHTTLQPRSALFASGLQAVPEGAHV